MKTRFLSFILALILFVSLLPASALAEGGAFDLNVDGANLTESQVKSKLSSVLSSYPNNATWSSSFDGGKQCYGFAKLVVYNVFGKSTVSGKTYRSWLYDGTSTSGMKKVDTVSTCTEANVKTLLSKAKPGDVLQFNALNSNGHQHSMVVYSLTSSGAQIYECNWYGTNKVTLTTLTYKQIAQRQYENSSIGGTKKRGNLVLLRSDNYDISSTDSSTTTYTLTMKYNINGGTITSSTYSANSSGNVVSGNSEKVSKWEYGYDAANGPINASTFGLSRTGYKFVGWSLSKDGSSGIIDQDAPTRPEVIYPNLKNGSATVTLYAVWSQNILTMKYNINGGTITSSTYSANSSGNVVSGSSEKVSKWEYGYDAANGPINASTFGLSRTGYKFVGWSLSKDGSSGIIDQDAPTRPEVIYPNLKNGSATVTMYAVWKKNETSSVVTPAPTDTTDEDPSDWDDEDWGDEDWDEDWDDDWEEEKIPNTITASNLKKTVNTQKARTFYINADALGDAELTFKSNNSKIKVNSDGAVRIPKGFIGKAVITITAEETDEYEETAKKITVTVNPAKTTVASAKNTASRKIVVKWKKNATVTGYEIQYSLNKDFAKGTTKSKIIKKKTTTSATLTGLTKGRTYYVRIRSYRIVNGEYFYSSWSPKKIVKITK